MDLRLVVHQLAIEHHLDARAKARLEHVAGLEAEPAALQRSLAIGVAVLAGALLGLGLIFWIAANWDTLGRFGRFVVLQGSVLVMGLAAIWRPQQRAPLALVVLLATGGLFAYFGQTYQTGADPWQLFALWAMLSLPLCLGLRSDVLWAPWVLVAMAAVSLWVHAHSGHRWGVRPEDLPVHLIGWTVALALAVAMSPLARAFTGGGVWALRTAAAMAVVTITLTALGGLFFDRVTAQYAVGLLALVAAAVVFTSRRGFDVFALSAATLGVNTLLVAGLARLLLEGHRGPDPIGLISIIGLVAAGLLAGSVKLVLEVASRRNAEENAQ